MKQIGMKILTVVLAIFTGIATVIFAKDAITAKRFQSYDTVTAIVVSAEDVTSRISSENRRQDETSTDLRYILDAYQNVKVQYTYKDAAYITELRDLSIVDGRTYYSNAQAQRAAETLKGYEPGDTIDVYTNGAGAMSVKEADKEGSILYVIGFDAIMAVLLGFMIKIYFCKPDTEE